MSNTKQFDIYRFMVEHSMDILFLLDQKNRFIFINERVESLLGFRESELISKHYSELVYPDDMVQADQSLTVYKATAEEKLTRKIEIRLKSKKDANNYRYFDARIVSIPNTLTYTDIMSNIDNNSESIKTYCIARDITHRKILENMINTNANHDYLTGLPNRMLLKDRMNIAIARAKREGYKFVVMFFDLDGFKQVNDVYGHSMGDTLLQSLADRLQTCLREGDTLARVGGDEFMLLLPDTHYKEEVKKIAEKLLNAMNSSFIIDSYNLTLGASLGIAVYPDDGETYDMLSKNADRAMYYIKRKSKNGYAFISEM